MLGRASNLTSGTCYQMPTGMPTEQRTCFHVLLRLQRSKRPLDFLETQRASLFNKTTSKLCSVNVVLSKT